MIARIDEKVIAKVLVSASGRNIRPSCASSRKTGRKETTMMISEKKSGRPTCFAACRRICWRSASDTEPPFWRGLMLPLGQVTIAILDHHDRSVDQHADRESQSAERHDVGADPEVIHRDKRGEQREGKGENRDQRGPEMEQEYDDHKADNDRFFGQIAPRVLIESLIKPERS